MSIVRRITDYTLLIKLVCAAILQLLIWPLPGMIGFSNPSEGAMLGRYTLKYFALLVGYSIGVLAWLVLTLWLALTLDQARLMHIRGWIGRHTRPFLLIVAAIITALVLFRALDLAEIVVLPSVFGQTMRFVPAPMLLGFALLLALLIDAPTAASIEDTLPTPGWLRASGLLALLAIIAFFLLNVIRPTFWNYPIGVDGGMHVYIGRHVLNGGVPYQTLILPYPPLRYSISLIWNAGADMLRMDTVIFARALNVLCSIGNLLLIYAMGSTLTKQAIGGLIAAALMLGTEHLQETLIGGPIFMPVTTLLMLMGLWMAQKGLWLWSGMFLAISTLSYVPVSVVALGVVIAALVQSQYPRVSSALSVAAGALVIIVLMVLVLLTTGILGDAYQQVVLSVLQAFAGGSDSGGTQLYPGVASMRWLLRYPVVFGWNFRGDWEIATLIAAGVVLMLSRGHRLLAQPEALTLLIPGVLLLITVLIDEGGIPDMVIRLAVLAPFSAGAILSLPAPQMQQDKPHLYRATAWTILAAIFLIGVGDSFAQQRFLYSGITSRLSDEERMAHELQAALEPDQTVLCITHVWYLALTGEDNAVPIRRFGMKSDVLDVSGWTPERVLSELEANKPAVVMWLGDKPVDFQEWLGTNYTYMGLFDAEHKNFPQEIYVLNGETLIENLIAEWPLEGN
jgi:hypothetical protein